MVGQKLVHMGQNNFGAHEHFFRRGHLTPKFTLTFFVTNLMLNIFMLNNFFGKSVFSKEIAKNCCRGAQCVITFGPPVCLKTLKKIISWNSPETSYSSSMSCLKYHVSFLSLTQMKSKSQKFNHGSE